MKIIAVKDAKASELRAVSVCIENKKEGYQRSDEKSPDGTPITRSELPSKERLSLYLEDVKLFKAIRNAVLIFTIYKL